MNQEKRDEGSLVREWNLLANYRKYGIITRDKLKKIAIRNLTDLESASNQFKEMNVEEKAIIRTSLQLDIVGKTLIFLEDLFVLAESFRRDTSYYDLLDEKDPEKEIGSLIRKFLEDLPKFSDEDIGKIMGYVDLEEIELEDGCKEFLKQHFKKNIEQLRILLMLLGEFSKTHHIIFKRFKHAGMPILFDVGLNAKSDIAQDQFDSWLAVSKGKDPMQDALSFPYSKEVIEGYEIVTYGLDVVLREMVTSRMECLARDVSGVIPVHSFYKITDEELNKLKDKAEKFRKNYASIPKPNLDFTILQEDTSHLQWYLNLPEYIKMNKDKIQDVIEYRKSIENKEE